MHHDEALRGRKSRSDLKCFFFVTFEPLWDESQRVQLGPDRLFERSVFLSARWGKWTHLRVCVHRLYNASCEEKLPLQRGPVLCCTLDNIPLIRSVSAPLPLCRYVSHSVRVLLRVYLWLSCYETILHVIFTELNKGTLSRCRRSALWRPWW